MGWIPPRPREDPNPIRGVGLAFRYALRGLLWAWKAQRNLRIQALLGGLALGLALGLGVEVWPILFLIGLVMGLELLNTALEALVDLVSPGFHPLAQRAKDVAAAAVLWASLMALLAGLFLFLPPLLRRLGLS